MMLAGVSTTHNSNLQKLLPLTVPWLPAHHNSHIHKLLVAKSKILLTTIITQIYGTSAISHKAVEG